MPAPRDMKGDPIPPSTSASTSRTGPAKATESIPGFRPLPDDGDPLGQLDACHDRMARQMATLERLLARQQADAAGGGTASGEGGGEEGGDKEGGESRGAAVDEAVSAAAAAVRKYFDEAAPRHHRDEEEDLFPALIESMAGSDAVCLHGIVDRLSAEHRRLESTWQRLRPALLALAQGRPATIDRSLATAYIDALRAHLAVEDEELMPMARRLLSDEQVGQIGVGMRGRRDRG